MGTLIGSNYLLTCKIHVSLIKIKLKRNFFLQSSKNTWLVFYFIKILIELNYRISGFVIEIMICNFIHNFVQYTITMRAKYVNLFTDFGFKKIFGEEANKPLLIDFLTCIIPEANIVDLTFKPKDKLGQNADDRKAVYDIYCESANGEKIIVELQKAKQLYFKDRTIYYSTFPIQEQAERGECLPAGQAGNFELKAVF